MAEKKNGVNQQYYYSVEIKLWYNYFMFNGINEGLSKYYLDNGQPQVISNYKNGNLEGEYKSYYKNRQLSSMINYKNNKKEGIYKLYFENGQLSVICNF